MTEFFKFFQQTSMVVFFALLTLSLPVLAQSSNSQNNDSTGLGSTPNKPKTGGGGRRDLLIGETCLNSTRELYLLAHSDRDRTTSSHPTLSLIVVSPDPATIELRLYEGTKDDIDNAVRIAQPIRDKVKGFSTYSLPADEPVLVSNKSYFWHVSLFCNPDRKEVKIWARAHFEVVEMPQTLAISLENASDRCEKIALYTEENLWYDALTEVLGWEEEFRLEALASFIQEPELRRLLGLSLDKHERFAWPCS